LKLFKADTFKAIDTNDDFNKINPTCKTGYLVPIEFRDYIPFEPVRAFYVCGVEKDGERGFHAHFDTKQYLICIRGKVLVSIYKPGIGSKQLLLEPNQGCFIDSMIWDSQKFLTGDDVLLVLSSTNYDPNDYIHDMDELDKLATDSQKSV